MLFGRAAPKPQALSGCPAFPRKGASLGYGSPGCPGEDLGMDFTEAYSDRCSAVGLAAREGNIKLLKKLIKKGYSIDVPDNRGWMAIHEAAFQNKNECLKLLIQAASSANYIRSKTFEGTCPLHLSARRGNLECTAILLESGADPNEVTNDATTPLFLDKRRVLCLFEKRNLFFKTPFRAKHYKSALKTSLKATDSQLNLATSRNPVQHLFTVVAFVVI